MLLRGLRENPLLRKAVEAGEERVGTAVGKLLASERFTGGVQTLVATALQARETLERGVSQALHAANLPSRDDVSGLKRRLEELESMLDGLAEKVDAPGRAGAAERRPRAARRRGGDGDPGAGRA